HRLVLLSVSFFYLRLSSSLPFILFFFHATSTTEIYTLSYTTLFRSAGSPAAPRPSAARGLRPGRPARPHAAGDLRPPASAGLSRSEEHTSELQSRFELVCRLLLEKKKNCEQEHSGSQKNDFLARRAQ